MKKSRELLSKVSTLGSNVDSGAGTTADSKIGAGSGKASSLDGCSDGVSGISDCFSIVDVLLSSRLIAVKIPSAYA